MPIESARRVAALALPLVAITLAAALRLDAITQTYGPVERPVWLRALQVASNSALDRLRPAHIRWERTGTYPHRDGPPTPYFSDPYTYLIFAREMRSFYGAHHREPVFPFATKVWLWLLNDQDVAVSFASASFSVLMVLATYLLGATLSCRWVGVAAAVLMAIDHDAISWGVGGWRDDAFTFGLVMTTWAMIRFLRAPSRQTAIVLGVCAGFTCLTRLTAVTFLVPGLVYLLIFAQGPFKARATGVLVVVFVLLAVAGPYLFNCWRAYGDPLYAISHLTRDQLVIEARLSESPTPSSAPGGSISAGEYVVSKVTARPLQTLDTVVLGLTSYPFSNKWTGLNRWIPQLGDLLSWGALAGLVMLAGSVQGCLVLLVLATSLLPAALTWRLAADWRFTLHAYPFFLVAACLLFGRLVSLVGTLRARGWRSRGRPTFSTVGVWAALIVGIAGTAWFVTRALPFWVVGETLRAREEVTIGTGTRDALFFREGWAAPMGDGNVTLRAAARPLSSVRLPLPVSDYLLTVRLDPFPRPVNGENVRPPVIHAFMNTSLLSTIELGWNPDRVGSYDIRVPRTFVRRGVNRLIFMVDPPAAARSGESSARSFAIWYVRIRPVAGL